MLFICTSSIFLYKNTQIQQILNAKNYLVKQRVCRLGCLVEFILCLNVLVGVVGLYVLTYIHIHSTYVYPKLEHLIKTKCRGS